jgi:hypothetical protein
MTGAGLVFGYTHENNFYRITFGIQQRTGFPFDSWSFDRMAGGTSEILAGDDGSPGFFSEFIAAQGFRFDVIISVRDGVMLNLLSLAEWETVAADFMGDTWIGPLPLTDAYWRLVRD